MKRDTRNYGKFHPRFAQGGAVHADKRPSLEPWAPEDDPPTDRGILEATPMWEDTVDPGMAKYPPNTPADRRITRPEELDTEPAKEGKT
jgi:hypothetical protein